MYFRPKVFYQLIFRKPYGIHSPFLYELAQNSFFSKIDSKRFQHLEAKRRELLRNNTVLQVTDFGQGSKTIASEYRLPTYSRPVKDIARVSLQSPSYCRLMWRLIDHFKPKTLLELGTSLGITTAYMADAAPDGQILSLEGCPQTANIAQTVLSQLGFSHASVITGSFQDTLHVALQDLTKVDFVYIDGDHSYKGVMDNFEKILPYLHQQSILILDDIRWSKEMYQAWLKITQSIQATMCLDLYRMGIVLFNSGLSKQIIPIGY